jgi:transposase
MRGRWEISDAEWSVLEPILQPVRRNDGRGRPWRDTRAVLNGVLWILGTGAQWRELPRKYPPYQTCHRRFQQWVRDGKLEEILRLLATELHARGQLPLDEGFIDASFTGAKKRGSRWVLPSAGKGTKILAICTNHSLPLAVDIQSASPHESQLRPRNHVHEQTSVPTVCRIHPRNAGR